MVDYIHNPSTQEAKDCEFKIRLGSVGRSRQVWATQ